MRLLRVFVLLFFPFAASVAGPEADVLAAIKQLQSEVRYSWESADGDPSPATLSQTGPNGSTKIESTSWRAPVRGKKLEKETIIEAFDRDGSSSLAIRRIDGTGVGQVDGTWLGQKEISDEMRNAFKSGRNPMKDPRIAQLRTAATALGAPLPTSELARFINDIVSFTEIDGAIVGEIDSRRVGDLVGGQTASRLTEGSASVVFRLTNGLLRQFEVRAQGVRLVSRPTSAASGSPSVSTEVPFRFERVTTINYAASGGPADVPPEARRKLAEQPERPRPSERRPEPEVKSP